MSFLALINQNYILKMFKVFKHIFISVLMMFSITGYTVSRHYCGTKLISVAINQQTSACCTMEDNCCQSETDYFQLEDNFLISSFQLTREISELKNLFPVIFSLISLEYYNKPEFLIIASESPPGKIQARLSYLQSYLC
jgi:hypothetical protein